MTAGSGIVLGVDGCRVGWIASQIEVGNPSRVVSTRVFPAFADILALPGDLIAVDIPIGLNGVRACDLEARRLLSPHRSS
jgi:predicted RNase H-like nuclease